MFKFDPCWDFSYISFWHGKIFEQPHLLVALFVLDTLALFVLFVALFFFFFVFFSGSARIRSLPSILSEPGSNLLNYWRLKKFRLCPHLALFIGHDLVLVVHAEKVKLAIITDLNF